MKSLTQFAAAICGLLLLSSSAAVAQSIASSYSWTSTGPIISAKSDSTHNIIAVKDPSAVFYNGQWIIYASDVNSAGNYNMEYLNIGSSWSNASAATPYFMDNTPGFSGYHTAPQVFYFAPQNKWYLIFQSGQPQYSTNSDPTKPQNWTTPKNFYTSQPASVSNWIDFWVICDSANCYLFFAGDNGNFYRASTPIGNFPNGFNTPVIVASSSEFNMFEADNVYSVEGTGEYLANIECIGSNGQRFFRALWASSLGGTWQSLGNTDNYGTPFLGMDDVTFNSGVSNWTESFSSGGLLIDGNNQTDSVNPSNLQFLYQGVNPANSGGNYNTIPWQLGLATSKANTGGGGGGGGGSISTTNYYQIVNEASGSCIDDTGAGISNGTVVQQYACNSGNHNQEWLFTSAGSGYYEVTTYNSSTASWNVIGPSKNPGTGVQLYSYYGGLNEQFEPLLQSNGYYEFVDHNSGLCLNFPSTSNGQQLQINSCNGSSSEMFKLNEL